MWDLSSPTSDRTNAPCFGRWNLNHWTASSVQFSSAAQSCPALGDPMECSTPGSPVHHQLLELIQTHVHQVSDVRCHPAISSSVIPFSSCLQSFPASGSFPMSQFFTSAVSVGALASVSVLPMNIHSWFALGLTDLISLQSKGLRRVSSTTIMRKHQFFGAQLSL